jgi:predicted dehydrogenase
MRVGLIGFGLAGEVFHAPLIAATEGLELATIVTGNPDRAAKATAAYPDARVTAESDAAWDADVVVVATPNRFHVSYAHEALARGVPAVIDKPLASTQAEVEGLLHDIETTGGKLTVFQNRRWDGDFLTAQQLVRDATLGPITRLTSRFIRFRPEIKEGWREGGDPRDGGGQLLDLGSHLIDQALVLLGPARRVYAEIDRLRPGVRTDDDVFVAIEHADGARSHLSMSAVAPVPAARLELSGLRGGFATQNLDTQEGQLRLGLSPASPSYGLNPPGTIIDTAGKRDQPIERGAYPQFYAGVRDWIAGDAPPPVDPFDSRKVFAVIEAARQSAAGGHVVTLDS